MDLLKVSNITYKIVSPSSELLIHNMQAFFRATKHISHATFPTLTSSIPIYNWLMDEIEDFQDNRSTKVKNAAEAAMEKLKKYYQKTDIPIYAITLSM